MPIDLSLSCENGFENELLDSSFTERPASSRLGVPLFFSRITVERKKTGAIWLCFPVAGKTTRLPRTGKA